MFNYQWLVLGLHTDASLYISLYIYLYISIYIYIYLYISIYIYIYIYLFVSIYIYMCIYINICKYIYVCVCIYLFIFTCVLQKWFRTSPQNCRRVMWVEPIYNLCAWLPMFENGPMNHIQLWNLDSWSWTWSEWPSFVAKYVAKLCEIHCPLLRLAQCCSLR